MQGYKTKKFVTMKLFIVTKEPFPFGMAAVKRIICLAKAFISAGVDCRVLVCRPISVDSSFSPDGFFEGIPYTFVGGSSRRSKYKIGTILQALICDFYLKRYIRREIKPKDVVCGYNISNANSFIKDIIKITHSHKAFYITDLCEYPFGTGIETVQTIKRRDFALQYLFPLYDGVITISEPLYELANKYCSSNCIIIKVPILVEYEKYNLPNMVDDNVAPYIFHSGTLYEQKDGILGMIEAYGKAIQRMNKRIDFVLTGDIKASPHKHQIEELIQKYNMSERIHFTGYLPTDKLNEKLSKASLVIINKYPNRQNLYCFSTKLGEYMAAGKPIIITRVGEAKNWLTDRKDAYFIEPNDMEQLTDAIIHLFANDNDRKFLGENARSTCIKAFDYHAYRKSLVEMIKMLG